MSPHLVSGPVVNVLYVLTILTHIPSWWSRCFCHSHFDRWEDWHNALQSKWQGQEVPPLWTPQLVTSTAPWSIVLLCHLPLCCEGPSPQLKCKLAGMPWAWKRGLGSNVRAASLIASEHIGGIFPASYPRWAQSFENVQRDAFQKQMGLSGKYYLSGLINHPSFPQNA